MRNRILSITRNIVPYVRDLRPIAGSVTAALIMQQLDYWFERHPDGFYKFMEPSEHGLYKPGQSWTEELFMSRLEFISAFEQIGIRYRSKSEFEKAENKFQGCYYASYLDRKTNLTHYIRNHAIVDLTLSSVKSPLALSRNSIPYVGDIRSITGSVTGCLVMQQLDYWFEQHPDGFFKFLEASSHAKYVSGRSWTEELGISVYEFNNAFSKIGHKHKSKTEFESASDKFNGMLYASYQDKRAGLTYYFRNHALVDAKLDEIVMTKQLSTTPDDGKNGNSSAPSVDNFKNKHNKQHITGDKESSITVDQVSSITVNEESSILEMKKPPLLEMKKAPFLITETNKTEINTDNLLLPKQTADEACQAVSSSHLDLILPSKIEDPERQGLLKTVSVLPLDQAQAVLDEVIALDRAGRIKTGRLGLTRKLVEKAQVGQFNLSAGVTIQFDRKRRQELKTAAIEQSSENIQRETRKRSGSLYDLLAQQGIVIPGKRATS